MNETTTTAGGTMKNATLIEDVYADLGSTNESGDGTRYYQEAEGVIFLHVYDEGLEDAEGWPIPNDTYRLTISISWEEGDQY